MITRCEVINGMKSRHIWIKMCVFHPFFEHTIGRHIYRKNAEIENIFARIEHKKRND